jgi:hypothetical protein
MDYKKMDIAKSPIPFIKSFILIKIIIFKKLINKIKK